MTGHCHRAGDDAAHDADSAMQRLNQRRQAVRRAGLPVYSTFFRGYDVFNYDLVGRTIFIRLKCQFGG